MIPLVWYIHGAGSTSLSFNWMKARLPTHEAVDINYTTIKPLAETISYLREQAAAASRPVNIIGHSLGGVIAAAVAQEAPVSKIVTMGSPFGGSFAASVIRWFAPTQLMRDVSQQSPVLAALRRNPPTTPILSFVTDSNFTILGERTDGVVTVDSQTTLKGPKYVTMPVNHFEVLLHPEVVDGIKGWMFGEAA